MANTLERERLVEAHVGALTRLAQSYTKESTAFLRVLSQQRTADVPGFIYNYLPKINNPFMQAAQTIGGRFVNLRAQQSGQTLIPSTDLRPNLFEVQDNAEALLTDLVTKQREGYNITNQTLVKSMERPIVDADRSVVLYLDDNDAIDDYVVGVRADGCNFCKSLSIQSIRGTGKPQFHNNCRCVYDVSFPNDARWNPSFEAEYTESYERAKAQIEDGELKVMSRRSKEWTTENKRDIQRSLRSERKEWEASQKPSKEQIADRRKRDDKFTQEVLDSALSDTPLSSAQSKRLKRSGFDLTQLDGPLHRMLRPSHRDIIKLMESNASKELYKLNKSL